MPSCSRGAMRFFLSVVGILFWASCITLMGMSIYVFATYRHIDELATSVVLKPAGILLAVGIFFGFAGTLGFITACKDNRCIFLLFSVVVLLVIGLLVAVFACGYTYQDDIDGLVHNMTKAVIDDYGQKDFGKITDQVDYAQSYFQCCGEDSYEDWYKSAWLKNKTEQGLHGVPVSCCKDGASCANATTNGVIDTSEKAHQALVNQVGCLKKLEDVLYDNLKFVAIAAVIYFCLLVVGFLFSCGLLFMKRDEIPYYNLEANSATA